MAKFASLVIKAGALVFIFALDVPYALQFQLLGGVWMIQIVPAVVLALYTRRFHGWALLIGWAVGTGLGTWMAWSLNFKGAIYPLHLFGVTVPCYIAFSSLIVNIVVSFVLSVIFHAIASDRHKDMTVAEDYA